MSLAVTVERAVKKIISTLQFARSENNVSLTEESRNPTPWKFPTLKKMWVESMMRSASRVVKSVGRTKYAATVAIKSLMETKGKEEREKMRQKKILTIISLR